MWMLDGGWIAVPGLRALADSNDRSRRIPAVERSPKTTPVVSGIGGIGIIRDPAIFGNRHTQVCVA